MKTKALFTRSEIFPDRDKARLKALEEEFNRTAKTLPPGSRPELVIYTMAQNRSNKITKK